MVPEVVQNLPTQLHNNTFLVWNLHGLSCHVTQQLNYIEQQHIKLEWHSVEHIPCQGPSVPIKSENLLSKIKLTVI